MNFSNISFIICSFINLSKHLIKVSSISLFFLFIALYTQ
nr:MAG TPA: hypothetical protein [Caudoviricetes sp.]